jgi:hypothetical protein
LIARDRLEIPLSAIHQRNRRVKTSEAKTLADSLGNERYESERVYAFVESEDKMRARGMKEAFAEFCELYPRHGSILKGLVEDKRITAENHLYFGVHNGSRLTTADYLSAIQSTGISEQVARNLYPDLLKVSRKLSGEREEERSIIVGKYSQEQ